MGFPARVHRPAAIVLVLFTALLVAAVLAYAALSWAGRRRIDECRRGLMPDSDAWVACSSAGSWFG